MNCSLCYVRLGKSVPLTKEVAKVVRREALHSKPFDSTMLQALDKENQHAGGKARSRHWDGLCLWAADTCDSYGWGRGREFQWAIW